MLLRCLLDFVNDLYSHKIIRAHTMQGLSSYATQEVETKGRLFKEALESERLPFLKDRERVTHSMAFRRLEYKTQVMVNHVGDHFRTRLTHTLEVAQNARYLARDLGLNEDLSETIAFAHDLGHPPFGHAGEDGLNLASKAYGGFDHNFQAFKIITQLEQKYAGFDGLNLTWETLEGVIKHNGPIENQHLPFYISEMNAAFDLKLHEYSSLEAQVAAISDDIAYCAHDIDDGFRAGVFNLDELLVIPHLKKLYDTVAKQYPDLEPSRFINELSRGFAKSMIRDVKTQSLANIEHHRIKSSQDVRTCQKQLVDFSEEMNMVRKQVMEFLRTNFYRYYKVNRMTLKAHKIMRDLFDILLENPNCLPTSWYKKVRDLPKEVVAIHVIDYIAGMTDRYAIEEHSKFFDPNRF